MIQVCAYCDKIYGEKEPYEDKSYTHGICKECLEIELEKLGLTVKEFEEYRKGKKRERRRINMPNGDGHPIVSRPKKGDFVLAFDDIWIIQKIKGKKVYVESWATRDYEEFFIDSFEFTPIRTWEVQ